MKKLNIILIVAFITLLFIPNLKAEDTIKIKSIILESKSVNAYEKSSPSYEGLDLNFDLEFREVSDYVKYKIIIENNTDKDFFLEEDLSFNNSEFIKYNYYVENDIKSNSESIIYLDISYVKEVAEDLILDNKYNENNKVSIKLLNENGEAAINPDTGDSFDTLTLVVLVFIAFVILGSLGNSNVIKLGVFMLCLIPMISIASEVLKIDVSTNVIIQKGYKVGYVIDEDGFIIPDEEKENYDLSKTTCLEMYVENYDAENKFLVCDRGVIHFDDKLYAPGEIIYYSYPNYFNPINQTFLFNDCNISDDNKTAYCDYINRKYYSSIMYYDKEIIAAYGYSYSEDDISKMKFLCSSNSDCRTDEFIKEWQSSGFVYLYNFEMKYNVFDFVMPEHDVLFRFAIQEV